MTSQAYIIPSGTAVRWETSTTTSWITIAPPTSVSSVTSVSTAAPTVFSTIRLNNEKPDSLVARALQSRDVLNEFIQQQNVTEKQIPLTCITNSNVLVFAAGILAVDIILLLSFFWSLWQYIQMKREIALADYRCDEQPRELVEEVDVGYEEDAEKLDEIDGEDA